MSKNTLCDAIKILELQHQLTPYQEKKCEEFFSALKIGDYVYPGHLKSKLAVDIKVAYEMLEELKKQGLLKNLYEVYCFDCNRSKGIFLESLEEFNPDMYCDFCGKHMSIEENIIVLYKVVNI
ncbi:MAG: hypothetical protein MRZ63_01055 [Anaerostipes sp.]|uniref:hypothetical protein n=1 Tax=Anaerostipes sp. 992a TaxID=1261637 RepID=UPI000952C865|nr:hypothetical protein [Anaerostipes sp. 992a]MCI5950886.1 hypothetical protein [Anaerostipes sp.]MDD5968458.1 hypothetical protein [Anaerostipes sp.]OLR62335.1 hypothetical protein BHF69_06365 [Anaerostipes sp. 992a]